MTQPQRIKLKGVMQDEVTEYFNAAQQQMQKKNQNAKPIARGELIRKLYTIGIKVFGASALVEIAHAAARGGFVDKESGQTVTTGVCIYTPQIQHTIQQSLDSTQHSTDGPIYTLPKLGTIKHDNETSVEYSFDIATHKYPELSEFARKMQQIPKLHPGKVAVADIFRITMHVLMRVVTPEELAKYCDGKPGATLKENTVINAVTRRLTRNKRDSAPKKTTTATKPKAAAKPKPKATAAKKAVSKKTATAAPKIKSAAKPIAKPAPKKLTPQTPVDPAAAATVTPTTTTLQIPEVPAEVANIYLALGGEMRTIHDTIESINAARSRIPRVANILAKAYAQESMRRTLYELNDNLTYLHGQLGTLLENTAQAVAAHSAPTADE